MLYKVQNKSIKTSDICSMQIHLLTLNIVVVKEFETEPKSYKESSHKNEPFSNSIRRDGGTGEAGASPI